MAKKSDESIAVIKSDDFKEENIMNFSNKQVNDNQLKVSKDNEEVAAAYDRTYKTVSTSFSGAGGSTTSRLDILDGIAKVSARNTGKYPMYVRLMNGSIYKSWEVKSGASLATGEFSVTPNTYWLAIGPLTGYTPTSGSGSLTQVIPL